MLHEFTILNAILHPSAEAGILSTSPLWRRRLHQAIWVCQRQEARNASASSEFICHLVRMQHPSSDHRSPNKIIWLDRKRRSTVIGHPRDEPYSNGSSRELSQEHPIWKSDLRAVFWLYQQHPNLHRMCIASQDWTKFPWDHARSLRVSNGHVNKGNK